MAGLLYFCGDTHIPQPSFDREKWSASHGPAETRPIIDSVIAALKEDGAVAFAGAGFCFGGKYFKPLASYLTPGPARYVFDLAFDGILKVSVVSHPSRLVVPDDLEVSGRR